MAQFSNQFNYGDFVTVETSGVTSKGEIIAMSDIGVTIEFEEQYTGSKGLNFHPWSNVHRVYKKKPSA